MSLLLGRKLFFKNSFHVAMDLENYASKVGMNSCVFIRPLVSILLSGLSLHEMNLVKKSLLVNSVVFLGDSKNRNRRIYSMVSVLRFWG